MMTAMRQHPVASTTAIVATAAALVVLIAMIPELRRYVRMRRM